MALANKTKFCCREFPRTVFSSFEEMRSNDEFCDITFRVADQTFKAHRVILAAAIPYLREKFLSGEDKDGKEINMPQIEPGVFKLLVEFAYTCEVEITDANVKALLTGACYFCMEQVSAACCDFLSDRLTPENVLETHDLACSLDCTDLVKETVLYLGENFQEVSQTAAFLCSSLSCVRELTRRNDLQVSCEEIVLEALLSWVKADPDERNSYLPELLRNIRLPLVDPCYLRNCVAREKLIRTSFQCRDLMDDARDSHILPEIREQIDACFYEPRCFVKYNCTEDAREQRILKLSVEPLSCQVECFDRVGCKWHCSSATFQNNIGVMKANDKMYFFSESDLFVYDPKFDTFSFCTQVPSTRYAMGVASLNNLLYVCGGRNGELSLNTVELYNPTTDKWLKLRSMHWCRDFPAAVGLGKYIYVLGGKDGDSVHDSVERYDTDVKRWKRMTPMLTRRYGFGCTSLDGRIYVCGGDTCSITSNCVPTAEVYDPVGNGWTFISAMNTSRKFFSLIAYYGKLLVLGGEDHNGDYMDSVESYDHKSDVWVFNDELKTTFQDCRGAVVFSSAVTED